MYDRIHVERKSSGELFLEIFAGCISASKIDGVNWNIALSERITDAPIDTVPGPAHLLAIHDPQPPWPGLQIGEQLIRASGTSFSS